MYLASEDSKRLESGRGGGPLEQEAHPVRSSDWTQAGTRWSGGRGGGHSSLANRTP